jgi:hypothetical protein
VQRAGFTSNNEIKPICTNLLAFSLCEKAGEFGFGNRLPDLTGAELLFG